MSEPETVLRSQSTAETVQAGAEQPVPPTPRCGRCRSIADHALRFDHVSMVFPDGTHAVDDVEPRPCGRASSSPSSARRAAASRRCCASRPGLETNTSGTLFVLRKSLGYVFQDATLLPWRTVGKNIELLAELQGVDKAARARAGRSPRSTWSACRASRTSTPSSSRAACGCGPRWPARWCSSRRCSCSTSRSARSTRSPGSGSTASCSRLFQLEGFAALFITHSITEAVFLSTRVAVMSARPGRILGEFDVPFPYPRTHDLRYDPDFAKLSGEISHALRGAHAVSSSSHRAAGCGRTSLDPAEQPGAGRWRPADGRGQAEPRRRRSSDPSSSSSSSSSSGTCWPRSCCRRRSGSCSRPPTG